MRRTRLIGEAASLIVILAFACALRFYDLRANPGWYSDEGAFVNVAENLAHGKWQYFALSGLPLLIGRPPLFLLVLAGVFKLFGTDIIVLRGVAAFYGILTIALLYLMARKMFGARLALLSAGILAVYPWAVAYSRIGFTYNQLAFLVTLSIYASWEYAVGRQARWGTIASLAAGLALATDYLGVVAIGLVSVIFLIYDWRWLGKGIILMGLPSAIILALGVAAGFADFAADFRFTLFRTSVAPLMQLMNVVIFYGELIRRETWVALGLVGLFLLSGRRARGMTLFVTGGTLLLLVRSIAPVGRNLHHIIPLFPLFSLGLASLLMQAMPVSMKAVKEGIEPVLFRLTGNRSGRWADRLRRSGQALVTSGIVFIFVVSPFAWMIVLDVGEFIYKVPVILTPDSDQGFSAAQDVEAVVNYLRPQVTPQDVVIASPQIAWAIPSQKADFAQALAIAGQDARVLPDLSRRRFVFDCSLERATYVVLDPLTREWGPKLIPALDQVVSKVQTWPVVFAVGQLQVYRNPSR